MRQIQDVQLAILMLHQAPQLLGCLREIVLVQCEELQLLATGEGQIMPC